MSELEQTNESIQKPRVFSVHGHDEQALHQVRDYVNELGLTPIILGEQPGRGRTIIERIEEFDDVFYAIILYTPYDKGRAAKGEWKYKDRARQNVVFEHGYFTGVLGRDRVAFLVKKDVQKPSDTDGLIYIPFNTNNQWRNELRSELLEVGLITE